MWLDYTHTHHDGTHSSKYKMWSAIKTKQNKAVRSAEPKRGTTKPKPLTSRRDYTAAAVASILLHARNGQRRRASRVYLSSTSESTYSRCPHSTIKSMPERRSIKRRLTATAYQPNHARYSSKLALGHTAYRRLMARLAYHEWEIGSSAAAVPSTKPSKNHSQLT